MITDTHCHLVPRCFPPTTSEDFMHTLVRDAHAAGVQLICAVSETVDDVTNLVATYGQQHEHDQTESANHSKSARILVFGGLHPVQTMSIAEAHAITAASLTRNPRWPLVRPVSWTDWTTAKPVLTTLAQTGQLAGIGEIGLDYTPYVLAGHPDGPDTAKGDQLRVLDAHLALASEHNLPVTIHSRSAGKYALAAIDKYPDVRVAMHAFDGAPGKSAVPALARRNQLWFSIPPSVCQANSAFRKLVALVPLERLLVESDAPALAPED
ncbi:putative deoxyribonuclease tatdn3 [Allomyces arbusculus]|nr:putative deoxyribonuclease tatdn3 [Allomyces arbusculus]